MTKSELFRKAHALAKATIQAGDDYRATFGAALKAVRTEAPQMQGTEKQIAWALDIKANVLSSERHTIARIERMIAENWEEGDESEPYYVNGLKQIQKARDVIAYADSITSAKWWIDNRLGASSEIALHFLTK
jgi:hypothetical protein